MNIFREFVKSVYPKTPILRNELINRRQISSQAASARRKLIGGMLDSQGQERLGINGYPPEMSIYLSLLFNTRNTSPCFGGLEDFIRRTAGDTKPEFTLPLGQEDREISQPNVRRRVNLLPNSINSWSSRPLD